MAKCEFEEKEFEAALYQQLGCLNYHLWAPGQVLEAKLGIDYSMYCTDQFFWARHGYSSPLPGVILNSYAPQFPSINRPLPNFSLNLFIQAKRPAYLLRARKKLKLKGLGSPHWRFSTDPNQQTRLDILSTAIGNDGLVCYAAPAFHRVLQLYAHTVSGSVVQNSTFPSAEMLQSPHKAWNYSQPGVTGVANAEPEFYEEKTLDEQVNHIFQERRSRLDGDAPESLKRLANLVIESTTSEDTDTDSRAAVFNLRRQQIDSAYFGTGNNGFSVLRHYLHVHNYATTFNMLWLTIGERRA